MTDTTEPQLRRNTPEVNTQQPNIPPLEHEKTETNPESQGELSRAENTVQDQTPSSEGQLHKRKPKPIAVPQVRDELTVRIEKILEDGVADAYSRLSPVKKQEFKLKGEAVARAIGEMVRTAHVKVKKILKLIIEWLKMLPGVNRFFLEQEAKIKTDRIIALTKHDKLN